MSPPQIRKTSISQRSGEPYLEIMRDVRVTAPRSGLFRPSVCDSLNFLNSLHVVQLICYLLGATMSKRYFIIIIRIEIIQQHQTLYHPKYGIRSGDIARRPLPEWFSVVVSRSETAVKQILPLIFNRVDNIIFGISPRNVNVFRCFSSLFE